MVAEVHFKISANKRSGKYTHRLWRLVNNRRTTSLLLVGWMYEREASNHAPRFGHPGNFGSWIRLTPFNKMTAFVDAECSQLMDSLTTFSLPGTSAKDYADFKSRIETFFDDYGTLSRWPCKPPELSPPQCARFGWTCANESMLVCVACKEYLDCEVSSSLGRKLHKECLSRLASSLEGAHKPCCPWKTAPCPKSYTVMQPVLRKDALSQLRERLETLGPISSTLPVLNTDKIYSLLSPEDILKIGKLVDKDRGAETQQADLLLAITGWQAGAGSGKMKLVTCEYCSRKVVTSFYKSAPISESRDEVTTSQDKGACSPGHGTKRKREEDELDPVHEHRPWCIWVLNDDSGKPGWLVFSECLLRNVESSHDDSRLSTSSVDAFKHDVEKIISSWREVVKHPTVQKTATS